MQCSNCVEMFSGCGYVNNQIRDLSLTAFTKSMTEEINCVDFIENECFFTIQAIQSFYSDNKDKITESLKNKHKFKNF